MNLSKTFKFAGFVYEIRITNPSKIDTNQEIFEKKNSETNPQIKSFEHHRLN
jgi:hypothetical protein